MFVGNVWKVKRLVLYSKSGCALNGDDVSMTG